MQILSPNYESSIKILNEKKPFIITSTGRTGTALFTQILNSVPDNYVVHEPIPNEQFYHAQALMYPEIAKEYLIRFRLREMAYRIQKNKCLRYGEVNGALRRHIVALKKVAPFFKITHIIRDGRAVITSVLNRNTFTMKDKIYNKIIPPQEDISPDKWYAMDRFQKICWMWANENKFMRENADFSVRFEDLILNYDYFKGHLLKPLSLDINYSIWKGYTDRIINATHGQKKHIYANWLNNEKEFFWNTCGKEMIRFKYIR
ncbi:MAG: hypothetical protein SWO11_08330 [Thermodesulfobacteriota bacterium]|nr:hypothetical protein [Thermodesulfobacteriota bacterium]